MRNAVVEELRKVWAPTRFPAPELADYARDLTSRDTRRGLAGLALVVLLLLVAEAALFTALGHDRRYVYTCALLALLAAHVFLSSGTVTEIRTLHLLGITLLVVSGIAFVLLAHHVGSFDVAVFASVALLFMVVPIVPWGLREAMFVNLLIYGSLTASTLSGRVDFGSETLATLQFVMVGAGAISLALVARNSAVRRDDIEARFELQRARDRLYRLSNQDPLTGAWNRRFLEDEFEARVAERRWAGETCYFALVDLDDFKDLNDTQGHEFGDRVLAAVSHAFSAALGNDGFVARIGGDEFALLFSGHRPEALVDAALGAVAARFEPDRAGDMSPISFSVGVAAIPPERGTSRTEVYRVADAALYAAKGRKHETSGAPNIEIRNLVPIQWGQTLKNRVPEAPRGASGTRFLRV